LTSGPDVCPTDLMAIGQVINKPWRNNPSKFRERFYDLNINRYVGGATLA